MSKDWIEHFDSLDETDQRATAIAAIKRLMEIEEVKFREKDDDCEASIYWDSCGEDLKIPF